MKIKKRANKKVRMGSQTSQKSLNAMLDMELKTVPSQPSYAVAKRENEREERKGFDD